MSSRLYQRRNGVSLAGCVENLPPKLAARLARPPLLIPFTYIALLLAVAPLAAQSADLTIRIPPVTTSINVENQPVSVTVSGVLSATPDGPGKEAIRLRAEAGLADLQDKITPILRAELNQDNRCGERLSLEQAALAPQEPASLLTAHVHYEKWGCAKVFGREMVKKLIGGNGVIRVRLTPAVENADSVRLSAEVLSVDADGQLGEALRSGSFGTALQEKIRKTVVSAIEKAANLKDALPPSVQGVAAIRSARFSGDPDGHLRLNIEAGARLPEQQAQALLSLLQARAR